MSTRKLTIGLLTLTASLLLVACGKEEAQMPTTSVAAHTNEPDKTSISDAQLENIVKRAYQYVAIYNVNNKFALAQGGWNTVVADTKLKDHTLSDIARPNNDTLYIGAMLDLRKDPVILDMPAFNSTYVSLMVTGYDHYVNVPMSVTKGDFDKPEKVLFYTSRTEGYEGDKVEGVSRYYKMTGDFISAVLRVMPHASDQARFDKIIKQMQSVNAMTLSEFQGKPAKAINDLNAPSVGQTDSDIYENNFLEVMQFIVNHTSFDPANKLDQEFLLAMKSLGVEPGKVFDKNSVVAIDGKRLRAAADKLRQNEFIRAQDPAETEKFGLSLFQPKGEMELQLLILQSVIGPLGLPASEAVYPPIVTADGQHMNAQNDYVIHMSKDELPPAKAFWSITLYDTANGFFIPNDHKKYSVGENAGMKLNESGGLDIYISVEKPDGVPAENWLPINRQDEKLDIIMRIYNPELEKYNAYIVPKAEIVNSK